SSRRWFRWLERPVAWRVSSAARLLLRRLEPQHALGVGGMGRVIARVALAVIDHDFGEIEGRDAFETGDVDAELVGVRAAFVVRVDAADRAKMMLRDPRIEPVGRELVLAFEDQIGR